MLPNLYSLWRVDSRRWENSWGSTVPLCCILGFTVRVSTRIDFLRFNSELSQGGVGSDAGVVVEIRNSWNWVRLCLPSRGSTCSTFWGSIACCDVKLWFKANLRIYRLQGRPMYNIKFQSMSVLFRPIDHLQLCTRYSVMDSLKVYIEWSSAYLASWRLKALIRWSVGIRLRLNGWILENGLERQWIWVLDAHFLDLSACCLAAWTFDGGLLNEPYSPAAWFLAICCWCAKCHRRYQLPGCSASLAWCRTSMVGTCVECWGCDRDREVGSGCVCLLEG